MLLMLTSPTMALIATSILLRQTVEYPASISTACRHHKGLVLPLSAKAAGKK